MPFNEALFWFGLTAFGTGLFFLVDTAVKRLYSISLTVIGVLGCAYSVYHHDHPESPAIHAWQILLVLTWALVGYMVYLRKSQAQPVAAVPQPLSPSKLAIHSADYATYSGQGTKYDVTECLRQMIAGNSLVLDIENHNFVVNGQNYVPEDPKSGKPKRLLIEYSYNGGARFIIQRPEGSRLVLPEDTHLKEEAKNAQQEKLAAVKLPTFAPLQLDVIHLARDLRKLLKDAGSPPELPNSGPKPDNVPLEGWIAEQMSETLAWTEARAKWVEKILYQYQRDFSKRVEQIIYSAGIEDVPIYDCNPSLDKNKIHKESDIDDLIQKLWQLFVQLENKV